MTCSSLNRLRLIRPPLTPFGPTQIWKSFRGSGHDFLARKFGKETEPNIVRCSSATQRC
jgi:hypothetical protein